MNEGRVMPNIWKKTTYISYLDESEDVDNRCYIFSAISIPVGSWNEVFQVIKEFRRKIRDDHGINMRKELHAREFVNGRGRFTKTIYKGTRHRIFREYIEMLASLRKYGVFITNACMDSYERAFDRVINRICTTLRYNSCYGILIFDEGNDKQIVKSLRKMRVHNTILSKYGSWEDGASTKNMPIDKIIAEASFRDSERDYLIQSVDFTAYALLRKEHPTDSILHYGSNTVFMLLEPVLNTLACTNDPHGVVRK